MGLAFSTAELILAPAAMSGLAYLGLSLRAIGRQMAVISTVQASPPPLSLLKPLCGAEPRLEQCLRSFLDQDYQPLQVIFGVRDADDPAVAVVNRLIKAYPDRDITLVADARIHGSNLKISNVINMLPSVRHPFLMVSDSDVEVEPGFLSAVMAELSDPAVGLVSAPYRGLATQGWVSRLGAANINQHILPAVFLDRMLNGHEAALGPALALRREALESVGGFSTVSNYLAEDCELGRRIGAEGWTVKLAPVTCDTMVNETSLSDLIRHEMRWSHTVRVVRPLDHALSVATCLLPVLLVLLAMSPTLFSGALVGAYMAVRLLLAKRLGERFGPICVTGAAVTLLRECLCFLVWGLSLFSRGVVWRGRAFHLKSGGLMIPVDGATFASHSPSLTPRREPAE